ncbi:MAG: CVNH domain-containing protein [Deltaproteobacteria bacterium]|nr:CVNH domain-containing protein [Deltaproteobacteria bacterium]
MNKTNHKLNYTIKLVALAILATFILVNLARAEDIPNGSYKRSCKDYKLDGPILVAKCRNRNGDWKSSRIIYRLCSGDIRNVNGELNCNVNQYSNLPKGSYKKSSTNYSTAGSLLTAYCKKDNGSWRYTDIKYDYCDDDIINDNGRLKCD